MLQQNLERELQILKLHKKIKYYKLNHEQKQYSHKRQLELENIIQFKFTNSKSNINYVFPLITDQMSQSKQEDDDNQDIIQNLHNQNEEQCRKDRICYYKIKQILQGDESEKELIHENRYSKTSMQIKKTFKKNLNCKIFLENYQSVQKKLNTGSKEKSNSKNNSNYNKYEPIKKNQVKRLLTEISNQRYSQLEKQSLSKNSFNKKKVLVNPDDKFKTVNSKYDTSKKLIQMNPFKQNTILQNKSHSNKKIIPMKSNYTPKNKMAKQNENIVTMLLNRLSSKQKQKQKQNYKNIKLLDTSLTGSTENNKLKNKNPDKIYPQTSKYSKKPDPFTYNYKFDGIKKLAQEIKIDQPYIQRINTDINQKNHKYQHTHQQISKRLIGELSKKQTYKEFGMDTKKLDKKQNNKSEFYQSLKIKDNQNSNPLDTVKSNYNTITNRVPSFSKDNVNFKSNYLLNLNFQSPVNKILRNNKNTFTNR